MRLYLNDTSPFARLVLTTALEVGIAEMELIWLDPWTSPENLLVRNPFSTVPTLELDNGATIFESLLICEYLMENAGSFNSKVFNEPNALWWLATSKTLMEFAFRQVATSRYQPEAMCGVLSQRIAAALVRALHCIESAMPPAADWSASSCLSRLCLVTALEYVHFRLNDLFTAHVGPKTEAWFETWRARQSLLLTTPERLKLKPDRLSSLRIQREHVGTPALEN